MNYRIAIGADHRGYEMKKDLIQHTAFGADSVTWIDVGTFSPERTDYPPYAQKVAQLMLDKSADLGILICGSGVGVAVAANRFKGIYSGVAWDETVARVSKEDDNINVLSLPADFISQAQLVPIVSSWLSAQFKQGRYAQRLAMIDK
jgi:ribose 5-phosphate isomerase B